MTVTDFLKKMASAVDASATATTQNVIQFNTSKPAYLTINNGTATVTEGTASNADVTLTIGDDDLIALLKGELNGMQAFMTGRLQLEGDMMLAQRMNTFFDRAKLG